MQLHTQIRSLFAMIGNREVNDQKTLSDNICEYKENVTTSVWIF